MLAVIYSIQMTNFGMIDQYFPKQRRESYRKNDDYYYRVVEEVI